MTPKPITLGATLTGLSDVDSGEEFYKVTVPSGLLSLNISTTGGTGDVDISEKRGSPAACDYNTLSCSEDTDSENDGNEESVTIVHPTAGDYYLDLIAYVGYSGVSLTTTPTYAVTLSQTSLTFSSAVGGTTSASKTVDLSFNPAGSSWTAQATTVSGGSWLSVSPSSGTGAATITITTNPSGLAGGTYQGTVTVTSPAGTGTLNVTLVVGTLPVITPGGVVGAGGSIPPVTSISPNGHVSIYGSAFAPAGTVHLLTAADLVNGNIPTMLAGVCVDIGGLPAYLTFVGDTQINVIAPSFTPGGNTTVVVRTACGTSSEVKSVAASVATQSATPEFLYWINKADGKPAVVAVNPFTGADLGAPGLIPGVTFTAPKAGDIITIYGVSFGPTTPSYAPGTAPTAVGPTVAKPQIKLNGTALADSDILYVGVSGLAGLYQINMRIPAGTPNGYWPVVLTLGTASTPAGYLTVQN